MISEEIKISPLKERIFLPNILFVLAIIIIILISIGLNLSFLAYFPLIVILITNWYFLFLVPNINFIYKVEIDENGFTLYGIKYNKPFVVHSPFSNFCFEIQLIEKRNSRYGMLLEGFYLIFNIKDKTLRINTSKHWTHQQTYSICKEFNTQREKQSFFIDGISYLKDIEKLAKANA